MRFPKRSQNVTDRFLSRFGVFFHFKSSKTTRYWVFYDKIILNLRVSFLFKLFLFIGKSVERTGGKGVFGQKASKSRPMTSWKSDAGNAGNDKFAPDFLTFCLKIWHHRFESSIWIVCAFYRVLRTSQIDSPWNSEHFSFFKRPTRPTIAFFRSIKS